MVKKLVSSYRKLFLALVLCAAIALGAGGVQALVALTAASESGQAELGTPFPSTFSADLVESDYTISTAKEFVDFATASRSFDFAGVTIHLIGDIDYSDGYEGVSFEGIGSADTPFCGTFDGHGYTVSHLYSASTGMFYVIGSTESPATIRDLTVDGAQICGGEGRAVLVCRFDGNPQDTAANNLIENVTVSGSTGSFSGSNCGILVGRCQSDGQAITISGCSVTDCDLVCTASSSTNLARWGMILGKDVSSGYTRIADCTVTGSDILSTDCNLDQVGLVLGATFCATQIEGCRVSTSSITTGLASDTVTQELGGIVGCLKSSSATITDCTVATTRITANGLCRYVGLLAGHLYGGTVNGSSAISSRICAAYEDETTQAEHIGGLIGSISNSKVTLEGCGVSRVVVDIASRGSFIGGLVGGIEDTSAGTALRDSSVANSYIRTTYGSDTLYSLDLGGAIGGILGRITAEDVDVVNVAIDAASPIQDVGGFSGLLGGADVSSLTGCDVSMCSIGSGAGGAGVGGLIGRVGNAAAKVWDCGVESTTMTSAGLVDAMGGLIGGIDAAAAGTVITDSTVSGLTMQSTYPTNCAYSSYIGGAIGRALGKVHATDVAVEDSSVALASLAQGLGGFAGYITGSEPSVLTECRVDGVTVTETQSPLDDNYKCYHVSTFLGCVDSGSKLAGCTVTDTHVTFQGRIQYLGGLIGATYSDVLQSAPVHGMVTVKNCAVEDSSVTTTQSRNCNESGGLIGWLSEGGTVTDCYVSGFTTPSNTNSGHVGGLIGYIPESTTDTVDTTVENCYVQGCTLSGKSSLSATIGNAVASGEVFSNNYYYGCTLNGGTESDASGASQVTSGLTDGTLVASLNTGSGSWMQGTASPVLDPARKGYTEVKVMSYNIYYLTQNESYPIADRQAKVIDLIDSCYDSGVGVMGLQEVTKIWYDYIDSYIKNENPNLTWCGYGRYGGTFGGFASGTNDNGDAFSLILFDNTRYSKLEEGHFWLSDTPEEKSAFYTVASNYRVVNWIRLRDKTTGEEFVFLNAHLEETQSTSMVNGWGYTLDSSSGPVARVQQARLICDQMAAHSNGAPVIMLGDWNSYTGTDGYGTIVSAGYQDLRQIAVEADQHGGYNAWSRTDPNKFSKGDHIVASALCTGVSCDVLSEEDLDAETGYHVSDHCPMIATIRT